MPPRLPFDSELDPARLYVLVLGIGNAFTRTSFNTSFILFAGNELIAIDCPAPYRRILHDAGKASDLGGLDIGDINHIVLTHLHGDHCNGLEEVAYFRRYGMPEAELPHLYLLQENIEPLWNNRLSAVMAEGTDRATGRRVRMQLEDYFQPHVWKEKHACRLAGDHAPAIEFEIHRTLHPVPCFGFRARFGGRTLAYSADTSWDPKYFEFLEPADLILHEAGTDDVHTPVERLEELPAATREKLLLVHVPEMLREIPPRIPIAREGALYLVGGGREPIARGSVESTDFSA